MVPKVEESEIVYENFIKIRRDRLILENQNPYNYYTMEMPRASVLVLGKTKDNLFLLTKEYRHPVGRFLLSCAGGFLAEGESPLEGAKRELLEESGYLAGKLALIGSAFPYPGLSNQKTFFVLAENIEKVAHQVLEPSEIIETVLLPWEEIEKMIASGVDLDGVFGTALMLYMIGVKSSHVSAS